MYYIVGLGNPGLEYEKTRHNVGRIAIDYIAKELDIENDFKSDKVLVAEKVKTTIGDESVILIKPNGFMNKSGSSISPIVQGLSKEQVLKKAAKIIVIHDDLDLPLGKMRILFNRGSGGHRGVESIKRALKTEAFIRIKVGVMPTTPTGKPKKPKGEEKVVDYILGQFQKEELATIKKTCKDIYEAVNLIVNGEMVKALNQFN